MSETTIRRREIPVAFRPLMDAMQERARLRVIQAGMPPSIADEYAKAIALYLALAVGKCVDYCSTLATWNVSNQSVRGSFPRMALPMTWDFVEANPLLLLPRFVDAVADVLEALPDSSSAFVTPDLIDAVESALDDVARQLTLGLGLGELTRKDVAA